MIVTTIIVCHDKCFSRITAAAIPIMERPPVIDAGREMSALRTGILMRTEDDTKLNGFDTNICISIFLHLLNSTSSCIVVIKR
jgi:hypothetical protein